MALFLLCIEFSSICNLWTSFRQNLWKWALQMTKTIFLHAWMKVARCLFSKIPSSSLKKTQIKIKTSFFHWHINDKLVSTPAWYHWWTFTHYCLIRINAWFNWVEFLNLQKVKNCIEKLESLEDQLAGEWMF